MSSAILKCISDAWMDAAWKILWQGSLSIVIIWGICRLWTKMPPFFKSWLWRLVYLKLLITFVCIAPLQVPIPASALSKPTVAVKSVPLTQPKQAKDINIMFQAPTPAHKTVPLHHDAKLPIFSVLPDILMAVWLVGVLLWARRLLRELNTVRILSSECIPIDDERILSDMAQLCARLGIRRIPKLMMHHTCGPMLVGLCHQTIILPDRVLKQMSKDDLRPAIAHELAHLKRHDLQWNMVASITQGLCFFNPLIGLSRREFALTQEMACDAISIETIELGSEYYSKTLLAIIRNCVSSRPTIAAAGVGESYHALERRLIEMSRSIVLSKRNKIIFVTALIVLAIAILVPWKARMQAQNNIHIVYKSVWSRPALPKEYVDNHIAGMHKELLRQWGPKWTNGMSYTEKVFKADWKKRYKSQANEVGHAEYWGTPTKMVWVYDRFGGSYFTSYNGKYVFQGQQVYGLRPHQKDEGSGYLLVSDLDRGRLEEAVPYLGFVQPGLLFYNAKRQMTPDASGWEERARLGPEYVYHYNHLRQPVSLELRMGRIVHERYEFSNYVRFQGIDYPKTVVQTRYLFDGGKPCVFEVTTYKAISIDNKPLSKSFDVERPPKGVRVQDLRHEFTSDPGRGLNYTYKDIRHTVTETSAILAAKKNKR
ncbi:MAG: M56 family metallopeptidase [Armatimonadota bacterium]